MIESEFSYEQGSGVVTYDTEATDPETFLAELADKTGFQGHVVESPDAPDSEQTPADGPDSDSGEPGPSHSNQ